MTKVSDISLNCNFYADLYGNGTYLTELTDTGKVR